jgi:hypothetical protein
MATPRKLNLCISFPAYGGNGGIASEVPDIRRWYARLMLKLKQDERIGEVHETTRSDTPITMVRNRFVLDARAFKCDVLMMVDSDMHPDLHYGEPGWKPFWDSSFDFLYEHYDKGPCVIGAPYCGPPGGHGCENMYVFEWENAGDHGDESSIRLEQVSRPLAARLTGIHPAAALPTGMILYDMRAFELIEPCDRSPGDTLEELIQGRITKQEALDALRQGWFYYEWTDRFASEKNSTEDVTNTRDISLAGCVKLGYNPVYCNWDSPVGHWKPWCVRGKPLVYDATKVAGSFRRAVLNTIPGDEVMVEASQLIKQRATRGKKKK